MLQAAWKTGSEKASHLERRYCSIFVTGTEIKVSPLALVHSDVVIIELILSTQRFGALQKITSKRIFASLNGSTTTTKLHKIELN